ncbi:MAG: hypothetical protein HY006_02360 [Candidatus Sungbacteria bacterium]|nr:hypothetical protein [Candidatus Sungbacteria bacterium]
MRKITRKISTFLLYGVMFSLVAYIASWFPHQKSAFTRTPPVGMPTAFADDHNDASDEYDSADSCDAGNAGDCM